MTTGPSPQVGQEAESRFCAWHPAVETRLFCSHCGKSICTQCLVQVPVGIRCPDCGKTEKLPTFDVQPTYYLRASLAGLGAAIVGGLLWGLLEAWIGGWIFVSSFIAIGVGYGIGEAISVAVNRKRGTGLSIVAGGAVTLAFLVALATPWLAWSLVMLLTLGIGVYSAVLRVR